ncbi:DUF2752 domain-containing protein [Flavobacterium amniphilum]|uniref:DUF2752 domain-containing protein n=1 Tax=Flavobacterium amniphilum TaxID=1834035 RepID=UPI00202A7EFE|nr:DUF2752 domain-containing protein [Flavobacterium amniphilum]MCL9804536.1 DUF2752 domain-containing protein [Flavobacterium amniphilum]
MNIEEYMIPCISKALFGVDCLGCGLQRSLFLLLQGKFSEAFHMYPPIYTVLIFFTVLGLRFFDKSRNYNRLAVVLLFLNLVIMVISYIYKHY